MAGNQGGAQGARGLDDFDFKSFLNDIPPVTRTLALATFVCTLGGGFQVLPQQLFGLSWQMIVGKLQVWRLVFSFLHLGVLGFKFLVNMYFLFHYSQQLENGFFLGRTANYCWMIFLIVAMTSAASVFVPMYAGGPALLMAFMHLWGRHSPTLTVKLYGFIAIPAKYLSLAMLALEFIVAGGVDPAAIAGLVAGHAYYFLDSVYPTMPNGKVLIGTPPAFAALVDQACAALASATGLGQQPQPPPPPSRSAYGAGAASTIGSIRSSSGAGGTSTGSRSGITMPSLRTGGHNWGSGNTLGSS